MTPSFPYIADQVGLPILGQPYLFSDAKMATFLLDSQASALNQLLDTYINQPSEGQFEYRCLAVKGQAFSIMIMAQMTIDASNPTGKVYGKERYSELSFWIPCYDRKALARGEFKPALFLPFLFPDSFSAIATGREMFGFRKQLAAFNYPNGELNVWHPQFTASTCGFKTLGADSIAQQYDFISLLAAEKDETVADSAWRSTSEAATGMIEHLFGQQWTCAETGEVLGDIHADFLANCPALFIKQFPAIEGAQNAEVRSIASAPFQLQAFHGGFPWLKGLSLKQFDLQLMRLASHPIVAQLGLTPTSSTPDVDTVSTKGFWVNVDFSLETGKTLQSIKPPKQKIAILGGGIGSLSTAYGITQDPDWQTKYDITIYQMGWRLGGKGASGRNRDIADRIEEHGLHIWFGYYDNAFALIQNCYAELARSSNAPLATWDQAFKPQNTIVVEEYVKEEWRTWALSFKPDSKVPGQGDSKSDHPIGFFAHLREALSELHQALQQQISQSDSARQAAARHFTRGVSHTGESILGKVLDVVGKPVEMVVEHEVERVFTQLQNLYESFPLRSEIAALCTTPAPSHWLDVIAEIKALVEQVLAPFAEIFDSIRRIFTLVDIALAVAKGILVDGVLIKGYTAINQYDFTEWLIIHGASADAANSALVRAFYDLYLGFPNGENKIVGDGVAIGGNVSAGELLHSYILVTLCYKGAVMWKMQAGMGDVVMTPIYQVLKQRGVKFEFFNKVTDLHLSADQQQISAIDIDVQATLKPNIASYNPLYEVKGLPCWPSTPLYEQLEQGQALKTQEINLESAWSPWPAVAKKTLQLGQDFDLVVLGISVAALPFITEELSQANPAWQAMLNNAATTQTQAMQLWLNINLEETGWPLASPILDAYGEPFNTWAAMDQTLDKENWPLNQQPFGIAYFCNNMKDAEPIPPFSDHSFPAQQEERVKQSAKQWLMQYIGHLWPYATQANDKSLDWSKLVDLENRQGEARLDGQYFRANIDPTERYVCNAANTNQYRLKVDQSGFRNLYLAGDWVNNEALNLGCVESTVISGLQAARALSGYPLTIHHETF
ncbi:NAD(P)-binding protein [Deefgea tanakiae]|uniref:NAD(P)-binding protein n=1 Tax=Deefgea tanakiae TaxID=2865840 RepID=A0ABX8Z343_9NEIS|nr:NAD(P)-binding protein [Deefgea tanakiae]QZA76780.1 NAD(P)-binding protein [Deefgea tanakiae]